MKNLKFTELLRALDKSEFREFGKFIISPYHNNRSEVVRFFDALKNFYPKFNSIYFTEAEIFKKVYPGKKYSDVMMRKLFSLTTNLLMDFFAVTSFKESTL
ncbi:MAG: hypothetical protein ABI840_02460, partial [bacterium]